MSHKISVLMSVYAKEKASQLRLAIDSVLNQTRAADEIVIVMDGPLTPELDEILEQYKQSHPDLLRLIPLSENCGLGLALRAGVPHCHGDLIARMDSDDISLPERFELEEQAFIEDPDLDIVGSYIAEFEHDPNVIISRRQVPLTSEDIYRYQRKRSALNHVTVMFKKTACLRAGSYKHVPYMEDDRLWFDMIAAGCKMRNLPLDLVKVRLGDGMIERRGGWSYFKMYRRARRSFWREGFIGFGDYILSVLVQILVAMLGRRSRQLVFIRILRRRGEA